MTVGERIKTRRQELQISQSELASIVGYKNRSSINRIENGERDIPRVQLYEIAQALQVTPSYLAGWEDDIELAETTALQEDIICKIFELSKRDQKTLQIIIDALLASEDDK